MISLAEENEERLQDEDRNVKHLAVPGETGRNNESPRVRRRLPRPSSAKLDQIFNFNFGIPPAVKPQRYQNARKGLGKNKNDLDSAEPHSHAPKNRFGFKNPYERQQSTKYQFTQPPQCETRNNPIRRSCFRSSQSGLNMNLNSPTPVRNTMTSTQMRPSASTFRRLRTHPPSSRPSLSNSKNSGTSEMQSTCRKNSSNKAKSSGKKSLSASDKSQTPHEMKTKNRSNSKSSRRSSVQASGKMSETGKGDHEYPRTQDDEVQDDEKSQKIPSIKSVSSNDSTHGLSKEEAAKLEQLTASGESLVKFGNGDKTDVPDLQRSGDGSSSSSMNFSTCSLASGEHEFAGDNVNEKSVKLDRPIGSKTTILSSCCDEGCHSLWSSNRSYFLRVTENRRKQHRKEWQQKQSKMSYVTVPALAHRDKAVLELQNELAQANHKLKVQDKEIVYLRKKIYMARAEKLLIREKQRQIENKSDYSEATQIYKSLPCELQECRDEKGHGDETVDGSLVVEVCGSNSGHPSKPCDHDENLPIEAGDVTNACSTKEYDQGYFSLPRRTESFTVSSPTVLARQLPTSTMTSDSTFLYHSIPDFSDSSVFSLLTPNGRSSVSCESVGCQTDLMLFSATGDEFNNTLILLQSFHNPELRGTPFPDESSLISTVLLNVVPNVLIVASLWRNSHGHIIDLELVLDRYVLPAFRRWYRQ